MSSLMMIYDMSSLIILCVKEKFLNKTIKKNSMDQELSNYCMYSFPEQIILSDCECS